jgi:hypothetical protein
MSMWHYSSHCEVLQKFYIFTLSFKFFYVNEHLMVSALNETCSVWKNNNKRRLCQAEYIVLFMVRMARSNRWKNNFFVCVHVCQ